MNRRVLPPLAALGIAVALPSWLLAPARPLATPPAPDRPLAPPAAPAPLRAAFARPLFAAPAAADLPVDAPQLLGIVGRLNRDAVALVRGAGGTRTLAPGDSIDGWQLRALAIDAAYFTRGAQSLRVPLSVSDS